MAGDPKNVERACSCYSRRTMSDATLATIAGDTMTKPKTKWCSGPGGMACGCCRIGKRSRAKRGYSRTVRRETRQALALEVTHAEL